MKVKNSTQKVIAITLNTSRNNSANRIETLTGTPATSNTVSLEVAGDFMFWAARKRRFGWFLEPAYGYSFTGGHQQSIGLSGGLLIAIR
jgi:hypothetical protein